MKQKLMSAAILAAVALLSSSCVTQKKYNELRDDYDLLTSQFNDAKIALASCETGSKSLEERLDEARANNARLLEQLNALQQSLDKSINQSGTNISKLVDEINASNKYIKQLTDAKSKSDSLNIVLTNNLTRSLSKEELKDVDVQVLKGVVYISLNDNMLYRTGSYEISDKAGQTLAKRQHRQCAHQPREHPQQLGPLLPPRIQRRSGSPESIWCQSQSSDCRRSWRV